MKQTLQSILGISKTILAKLEKDHLTSYSAMSAYFLLMSFVPFVMLLLMLAKYLPFTEQDLLSFLDSLSFIEDASFLQPLIQIIYDQTNGTFVSITVFVLLYTASKCMWGFMKGLHSIYQVSDDKGGFLLRFWSFLYTIAFLLLITGVLFFNFFKIIELEFWRNFVSLLILTLFFLLLYRHGPRHSIPSFYHLTGAVFTSVGWTVFSRFFSYYVTHFSTYARLYGELSTLLLFFLWLYILMYILFLGGEINAFIYGNISRHR